MRKPQIPSVPQVDQGLAYVLRAMKENIELINGSRGGKIELLPTSPTNQQIALKINEIIERISS